MRHVYEKGGLLTFLVSFVVLIGFLALGVFQALSGWVGNVISILLAVGLIGGLLFAGKGGGALGVVESVGQLSHVASYIRIMAVGLAGAIFETVLASTDGGPDAIVSAASVGLTVASVIALIGAITSVTRPAPVID